MKRSQIKRRPLADTVLASLEPEEKAYRELDGLGLYLRVKPNGSKSWELRYKRPNGKWSWKGLGGFPTVSGKAARRTAEDLRRQLSDGIDIANMSEQGDLPTFRASAESWYQRKLDVGRSEGTTSQMRRYLDGDILPRIGDTPLANITRADCTAVQRGIEARGAHNIAEKVRSWVNQIFSEAIAEGLCELNPASELRHIAAKAPDTVHYPHLLEVELPAFLVAMSASRSRPITQAAVWMALRTASRPGMVRFAEWPEISFEDGLWVLNADKMKMRRDHVVPLSTQTLDSLKEVRLQTGRQRLVFPGQGPKNPVLSENTINQAIAGVGYKGKLVGHGARHTASTLLREHGWNKDLVEAQLAHKEGGIAGVYNQAQYIERRRRMMQWYSDYLDALRLGINEEQTLLLANKVEN
ncbi:MULTISPECIES: tyrosine-type recombinase/integrase [unclassified Halomonas]|uniref:tyrosine-type recombinase/integrase n=1 Tax=unclassified Halomonas TaxID=2609666 RepID=UPI0020A1B45E|nr:MULTISPECIES: tyrosine-type recombinase/integrase [unclassified Halomonas]MCP1313359.1 tyrosine-type recombinase/integrase [Halomonas sp. 707D7]MCP1326175.1 tyrosine-type recombinase/integrase [Halomonas sp. 707D4]